MIIKQKCYDPSTKSNKTALHLCLGRYHTIKDLPPGLVYQIQTDGFSEVDEHQNQSVSSLKLGFFGFNHSEELRKGSHASLLGSFCLKDRCGLSPCNGLASCPEGCMAKLLHASKTGDNLLSNGPHHLKQGF